MLKVFECRLDRRPGHARAFPFLLVLFAALLSLGSPRPAFAAFNNATPRDSFAGTHNYVVTGNTLRTKSNTGNP